MTNPIIFSIKETFVELRKIKQKARSSLIKMVYWYSLNFKKKERSGISKIAVSKTILVNYNSVLIWRNMYIKDGLPALLKPSLTRKLTPSVLYEAEPKAIVKKLKTPTNRINGYLELMAWVKNELNKDIYYITLVK